MNQVLRPYGSQQLREEVKISKQDVLSSSITEEPMLPWAASCAAMPLALRK